MGGNILIITEIAVETWLGRAYVVLDSYNQNQQDPRPYEHTVLKVGRCLQKKVLRLPAMTRRSMKGCHQGPLTPLGNSSPHAFDQEERNIPLAAYCRRMTRKIYFPTRREELFSPSEYRVDV